MAHRLDKIENLIKEEISLIFLYKITFPEIGFITVTGVKVSPDLKIAKVYLSVLEKEHRKLLIESVNAKIKPIRMELASRINLKFVPELKFFIDDTLDYVEKIEGLIKQIHSNDNQDNN